MGADYGIATTIAAIGGGILTVAGLVITLVLSSYAIALLLVLVGLTYQTVLLEHGLARKRARQHRKELAQVRGMLTRTENRLVSALDEIKVPARADTRAGEDALYQSLAINAARFSFLTREVQRIGKIVDSGMTDLSVPLGTIGSNIDTVGDTLVQGLSSIDASLEKLEQSTQETSTEVKRVSGTATKTVNLLSGSSSNSLQRRIAVDSMAVARLYANDPILGRLPLSDGWAMDPVGMSTILELVERLASNQLVLELGSGVSTVWLAHTISGMPKRPKFVSLEHDLNYFAQTRRWLKNLELEEYVELRLSPLKQVSIDNENYRWYSHWEDLGEISLLIVDGPPQGTGALARYPAVPSLAAKLEKGALVALDDVNRADEQEIARTWTRETYSNKTLTSIGRFGRVEVFEVSSELVES